MSRRGRTMPTIEGTWAITLDAVPLPRRYARAIRGAEIGADVRFRPITWTWGRDGEVCCEAECAVTIHQGGDSGALRLHYVPHDAFDRGHGEQDWTITLVTTRPPFGGRQWWFLCPISGRRCRKLFLPAGGRRFLSRQAYGLGYLSQRITPASRAQRTIGKLCRRLGGEWGVSVIDFPPKPKGMRWAIYQRIEEKPLAAEEVMADDLMRTVARLTRMARRRR